MVSVTCPSCGGKVVDAELGERTRCRYCGTDLHLPAVVQGTARIDATHDPTPPSSSREHARRAPPRWALVAFAGVACVFGAAVWIAKPRRPTYEFTVEPPVPPATVQQVNADASCLVTCNGGCLAITDSKLSVACLERCGDGCKGVAAAPAMTCGARCDVVCEGTADPVARLQCKDGCRKACLP